MVNGKSVVSSILAVVLALGLCPLPAFAGDSGERLSAGISNASQVTLGEYVAMFGDPVALESEAGQSGIRGDLSAAEARGGLVAQTASGAFRDSGSASVPKPTADELRGAWKNLPQQPAGKSIFKTLNDNGAYTASTLTDQALSFSQAYLNFIRSSAGLTPIALDDTLNANAAQGALILSKLDAGLTHTPGTPSDVSEALAKPGKYACATSNLSMMSSSGMEAKALGQAIQGQMDDSSSESNLSTLGHRRWLLNPSASTMGIGSAYSYSSPWDTFYTDIRVFTNTASAYYDASYGAVGQAGETDYDFIAWPASGVFARNVFPSGTPWSVTLNPSVYQAPSAGSVQAKVTRVSDGQSWTMTSSSGTPSKTGSYLVVENSGYGVANCIIFNPGSGNVGALYDGVYQVEITGLKMRSGASATLAYEVDFIDAALAGSTTDPDPGTNPGSDPGTNPGTDPGANPGTDPGVNPGTNPDPEPAKRSLSAATVQAIPDQTYSGLPQQPVPVVRLGSTTLRAGVDFEVVGYANNTAVGTATLTIAGKGDYEGAPSASITFRIVEADIADATIALASPVEYAGVPAEAPVTVTFNGKTLVRDVDYTLVYSDNTGVGTAKVNVSGAGNFTGSVERTFEIVETPTPTPTPIPTPGVEMRYGVDNARLAASMVAPTPAEDFYYDVASDGMAVISGYVGTSRQVVVPCALDGHVVVGLFKEAFSGNTLIEEVYLPDTIEVVEETAFEGCTALRCLNLGGIRKAFSRRTESGYTTGASGYQWILHRCTGLKRLTMSDNADFAIEHIYGGGNNFNIMEQDALDGIEYIYLGSSMSAVPANLFYGKSLQRVDVGEGNALFSSVDGAVYSADGSELLVTGTGRVGSYVVPSGVERIGPCGFQDCADLTEVVIPESVTEIDESAFSGTNAVIVTPRGSYADFFAQQNGVAVEYDGKAASPYKPVADSDSAKVDISNAAVSGLPAMTYTGKAQQPKPSVRLGDRLLVEGVDYTLSYTNAAGKTVPASQVKAAGAYRVVVKGAGVYSGSVSASFAIAKAANSMKVSASTKTVKVSKLRKKAVSVNPLVVKTAQGKVTYAKASGSARLTVNKSTGKVTVKKGTPRAVYTIKVKVKAVGDANHKSATKTQKVTLRVK